MPINPAFRRTDLKTEQIASEIETILARYSRAGTRKGNAGNYRVPAWDYGQFLLEQGWVSARSRG